MIRGRPFNSFSYRFQKCCDPNPRLDPVGGSKPEPGLLRHFQLSSQNILFGFIKFSFSKVSRLESTTQPGWRIQAEARFTPNIFNYLLKTCCLCYSILDFLITRKHFILGKPINIYKFKRPITFTFNKMYLQNNAFI